jgi:hypothetical protein
VRWQAPALVGLQLAAVGALALGSSPPPTLGERRHRGLARRGVAVCWRAVFVVPKGYRPHPRVCYGRGVSLEDAPDHPIILEHVEIIFVPLA